MEAKRRPRGALESEVMAALWAAGKPLSPADVQATLGGGLAYNTVQTILIRLMDKELVRRAAQGRGHIYWPVLDAATTAADRMRAALDARPDRQAVLQQFAAGLGAEDAEVLRALLDERTS
ncbi:BlaI/MecI/CopY family transcriptional regulator [Actinoplanes sp. TBRC 11911]|uniref:BlaI/MecI/CopY family transcriptional regulator n=1 Tax=Actinoplanes sp. TBRC 11911 TaxID=2729386 RepID=UPI00145C9A46|nr:BlaI/MecI/CopY family transcriptional regulator [Actinoplanes sp. TBRC 11911]NMO56209.1 BlaI/MecI/CopY family transcriptional regulator [Actinoplanes sp. TBRC 11911]